VSARTRLLISVAGAAFVVSACSSGSASHQRAASPSQAASPPQAQSSSAQAADVAKVTVGIGPTLSNVPVYLGVQDGTFAKHGLNVTPQVLTSGAQAVTLLLNGQTQFALSDTGSALVAISKNIPLEIVAVVNLIAPDPSRSDYHLIVDPGIADAAGLANQTIAVPAIGGQPQVDVENAIDSAGGDSAQAKFIAMPVPQMLAATKSHQIDGFLAAEPQYSESKAAGLKDLMAVGTPGEARTVYLAERSYVQSHASVVKSFVDSLMAENEAVTKDPSLIRSEGQKSTSLTADILGEIIYPVFVTSATDTTNPINIAMNLMVKYKALTAPIDLSKYTYQPS
jgi:NitT/TauT family transport system substrate-binding protein